MNRHNRIRRNTGRKPFDNSDNDWFFEQFEGDAKKVGKNVAKVWALLALANLVVWAIIIFLIALAVKWVL